MTRVLLHLTPDVVRRLRIVLEVVEHLDDGADAGPALDAEGGWGDLDRFRRQVSDPLRRPAGVAAASTAGHEETTPVDLDEDETSVLAGVVHDASVSFSTGRPWSTLTPRERTLIARIRCRLTP